MVNLLMKSPPVRQGDMIKVGAKQYQYNFPPQEFDPVMGSDHNDNGNCVLIMGMRRNKVFYVESVHEASND